MNKNTIFKWRDKFTEFPVWHLTKVYTYHISLSNGTLALSCLSNIRESSLKMFLFCKSHISDTFRYTERSEETIFRDEVQHSREIYLSFEELVS